MVQAVIHKYMSTLPEKVIEFANSDETPKSGRNADLIAEAETLRLCHV